LFRSTDRAIVKGFRLENLAHGFLEVCRTFDISRTVTGADTDGRRTGGIGCPHHGGSARGQDHRRIGVAHQVVRRLDGWDRDATDQVFIAARLDDRLPDDLDRLQDAALSIRVWREDDGIAGLDGDDGLEQSGRGRIGGGDQSGHDTDRDRKGADPQRVVARDLTDGFHVLDPVENHAAGKNVLDDLVVHDAKARF